MRRMLTLDWDRCARHLPAVCQVSRPDAAPWKDDSLELRRGYLQHLHITTTHATVKPQSQKYDTIMIRDVKQLISLTARLTFSSCINRGFNVHFVSYTFQLVHVLFAGRRRRPIAVERWSTSGTDD